MFSNQRVMLLAGGADKASATYRDEWCAMSSRDKEVTTLCSGIPCIWTLWQQSEVLQYRPR